MTSTPAAQDGRIDGQPTDSPSPWPALWALSLGFFMVLLDSTVVSIATPTLMESFDAGVSTVVWVTSAYLLAYAVPLLVTGRLGDRYGPRTLYLAGLAVFTAASVWCGLAGSIETLIAARALQGLGAAMLSPQTMAVITKLFPGSRRGQAMALWGATAGVATLVGPLLGGLLVDSAGWRWIFFINLPIGIAAFLLAWRLVPTFPTTAHSVDWLGVALSALGMSALIFGIQEGQTYDWGRITGWLSVPLLIGAGLAVMALFVVWQALTRGEPLVPLTLFRSRNFSLANIAISTMGFTVIAASLPYILWLQSVRGMSPTGAALLMAPSSVLTLLLAKRAGELVDRIHPRTLATSGLVVLTLGYLAVAMTMRAGTPTSLLLLPWVLVGLGSSFVWAPLSTSATRTLPPQHVGAGAGVYNTTRQVGSVIGSAAIAAIIESRLAHHLGGAARGAVPAGEGMMHAGAALPPLVAERMTAALRESMLATIAVLLLGVAAAAFLTGHQDEPRR